MKKVLVGLVLVAMLAVGGFKFMTMEIVVCDTEKLGYGDSYTCEKVAPYTYAISDENSVIVATYNTVDGSITK